MPSCLGLGVWVCLILKEVCEEGKKEGRTEGKKERKKYTEDEEHEIESLGLSLRLRL